MQEPRIETKPAIAIVGLPTKFISGLSEDTNAPQTIGPLWGQLNERMSELTSAEPGVCYGWCHCLPPDQRQRPDEHAYVAGVASLPGSAVPDGMVAVEAPAGLYAVFEHRGVMWTYGETLLSIYNDWLPNSDYLGNGIGDLERYDERWVFDSEDSVFECWVGIQPKP